mmetsp:Transcript_34928/g.78918  ORF Transcript_34928/g.78918 Transcript_34928/m.78918 type:complete len:115 (-) Transcript_34928:105-449(-)
MSTMAQNTMKDDSSFDDVAWDEIKSVQVMIERCMQHYLTQAEIITTLQSQMGVRPSLTTSVLRLLEEQNGPYFYSYNVMLRVKDQLTSFNYLADQQKRLINSSTTTPQRTAAHV